MEANSMWLGGTRVGNLTTADLAAVIEAQVPESERVEYKLELPGKTDGNIHEFLADVSSLANTAGGVLVFGVDTERDEHGSDTGIPCALAGITVPNRGALQLRLLEILNHGLQPRMVPEAAFQFIEVGDGKSVLVVGVTKSFAAPHMIWAQRSGKMYRRTSAGKLQADVEDARRLFLEAEEWTRESRAFCKRRVADAQAGTLGFAIGTNLRTFLHVLPLGRVDRGVDLFGAQERLLKTAGEVLDAPNNARYDFDGLFAATRWEPFHSYVLWLRTGGLECGTSDFRENDVFWVHKFTDWLLEQVPHVLSTLTVALAVEPPFSVHITLLDMRAKTPYRSVAPVNPFRLDRYSLPPVIITDPGADFAELCRPTIDVLWQSAGYPTDPLRRSREKPGADPQGNSE